MNRRSKVTGKVKVCFKCRSRYHLVKRCQQKEKEAEVLHVTGDQSKLALFTFEALGCGVLDTARTVSVAGERWFISYKRLLGEERALIRFEGIPRKTFRFGNKQSLSSLGTYVIPAWIAGRPFKIKWM